LQSDIYLLMKIKIYFLLFTLFHLLGLSSFSQSPPVVISSYYNAASPLDEWSELLVIKDNTNMSNWKLQNTNSTQTSWEPAVTFSDTVFWNHMRAGTIIVIYHRCCNYGECVKGDGYTQVTPNDPNWPLFSGGNFGNPPDYNGPTLNINSSGALLVLLDANGNVVHALGHRSLPGPLFNSLPLPKLNYNGSLNTGEALFVCPGSNPDEYGNIAPQNGSTWASVGVSSASTPGLPKTCTASGTANSDFRRNLRQPLWTNPTMTGSANDADNLVTLIWNAQEDAYPPDGTEKYLILRNTSDNFDTPADGRLYDAGETIGQAIVAARIESSQILKYVDTVAVPCTTGLYYRIYALRYCADYVHGNKYNPARGSAYNEESFTTAHVSGVLPTSPSAASCDRDSVCSNDNGTITLSATGGAGAVLKWYSANCGLTLIGTGDPITNSLTIPSPESTTTYYANWENECGTSACANVTVKVIPAIQASLNISVEHDSVCEGTPLTITAHAVNEGNSPVYAWTLNGDTVQKGGSTVYTGYLKPGDKVKCWLTSSFNCLESNPVSSLPLSLMIYPSPVIKLTDQLFLCEGDPIQLNAGPGFASYLWQDGSTGQYYNATERGIYKVTVTDYHDCKTSDSVQMKDCDSTLFLPNVFSPNNDGLNDVFKVMGAAENVSRFNMQIFDRWGELVFETNLVDQGWDGNRKNKPAPADTYIWVINYQAFSLTTESSLKKSKRGTVVLIR